jgi:DNA ligase-1
MSVFRPMKPPQGQLDLNSIQFPCYGSIKYDGFRLAVKNGKTVLNSLRELDNLYTRKLIEEASLEDHDGELVILPLNDNKCFNRCQSAFRAAGGEPDFRFVVFDRSVPGTFEERWVNWKKPKYPKWVMVDKPVLLENRQQLDAYVDKILADGHEGVILRRPDGQYITKRATFKSQEVLRIKPMETDEGTIVGFECEYANTNQAEQDNLGHTKRSSAKAGKVAKDTLGKLILNTRRWGEVKVSGFTDDFADEVWRNQAKYLGDLVTYSFQLVGSLDKPRLLKFKGIRARADMS